MINTSSGHMFAKKHLGQNFLKDQRILRNIADACALKPDETLIEIGPGRGALTEHLLNKVGKLIAIEKDPALADYIQQHFYSDRLQVIKGDFLRYDFQDIDVPGKVVGNIPYYISSPIIEHVIEHKSKVTEFYMTIQWELGQRLVALPGGKEYGSFSCFIQYHGKVDVLFKISKEAFFPKPKVDSCLVRLDFTQKPQLPEHNQAALFKVIRTAFQQRRKTILNALSVHWPKEHIQSTLEKLSFNPQARAENFSLKDFVVLSVGLHQE